MLTRVAFVGQPGAGVLAVRQQLRNPVRFVLREFLSMEEVNDGLKEFPFEVLIARVPTFDSSSRAVVERMRARFPHAGLVTMAKEIDPVARYQVRQVLRHKLMDEKLEINDLGAMVEMLKAGSAAGRPRLHPRARRTGEAELVEPNLGLRLKAKFVDFAQMGASLVFDMKGFGKLKLPARSRVQLHYPSSTEPGKIHRIEALVVWAEFSSGMMNTIWNGPTQRVGLRFIAAL